MALAQATQEPSSSLHTTLTPYVPFCTPRKGAATDAATTGTTLSFTPPSEATLAPVEPITFTARGEAIPETFQGVI